MVVKHERVNGNSYFGKVIKRVDQSICWAQKIILKIQNRNEKTKKREK